MRCTWLLLVALVQYASAARILGVFPMPAKSHHNVIRPIVVELAKRGHDVTFVTPIPVKDPPKNLKQIMVKNFLEEIHGQIDLSDFGKMHAPLVSHVMTGMGLFLGNGLYSSPQFQKIVHSNDKYDAIFTESLFIQEPVSALMHKFGAIGIDIQPLGECSWVNEVAGLPDNPAYMVDFKSPYTDQMDYWERLHNAYITYSTTLVSYLSQFRFQWQMDEYFNYTGWESRPPLRKLNSDKALILTNSHFSVGYSYPKAPHVKEIGGINVQPNQPLPKDLEDFMNGATDGVIYFSFGSNVQTSDMIKSGKLDALVKVFSTLKQRVLWKWESDQLPTASKNVKFSKWFPQQDILAHKNIRLFISHGGVLSIFESIHHGVPLICVPFFGDQGKNARHIEAHGYGVKIEFDNITESSMTWAINEILQKPSYKLEAQRRSHLLRDRPQTAMQEAIYWIEYVLKHKNVLQPHSVHMPFYQVHMLDIWLPLFLIAMFVVVISLKIIKAILCCICKKSKKKPVDVKKKKN